MKERKLKNLKVHKIKKTTDYIAVILFTLFIFLTIPYFSKIWISLEGVQQKLAINILYFAFFSTGIVLIYLIFRKKDNSLLRLGIFLILSYFYVEMFLSLYRFPAEKFHLAEYGVLSFFAFRLFVKKNSGISAIVKSFFYAFYVSIIDETIQWIVPGRVGTYEDIILNIKSALLSLGVVAVIALPLKADRIIKTRRKEAKGIVLCCIAAVILLGFFLYFVHDYGYEIKDRNFYFYSYLSRNQISEISERLIKNKGLIGDVEINRALNEKKIKNLKGEKRNMAFFLNERHRHMIERDIALSKNKKEKAYFEKRIVEDYYSIYSRHSGEKKENQKAGVNQTYKSPVNSNLIIVFTKSQLVFICIFFICILSILECVI